MLNNRILLASPCYDGLPREVSEDWMRFAYHCGRRIPEYEFFIGLKDKSEQFRARNMIVEGAQQHNCDRILMLDDDMIIDWQDKGKESFDFLRKLIAHDKHICGVLYYQRGGECEPVLMKAINDGNAYRMLHDDEVTHSLQQVDVAGGGCLLIQTRIFDRIPFPYFAPEHKWGTDIQLCEQARKKGFEVWADTSIELGHLRNERVVISSANRHIYTTAKQTVSKVTFVASDLYGRLVADAEQYTGLTEAQMLANENDAYLELKREFKGTDAEWYREFPLQRIGRHIWYNTQNDYKKRLNQYILSAIPANKPLRILDFGCGLGVTAYALAEKGHAVTALDIRGGGGMEFLKWRTEKHGVPMKFIESEGEVPTLSEDYDVIIAMDSLEHITEWKQALNVLADHLRWGGFLFSNNAVLYDKTQPEHYDLHPEDFLVATARAHLHPHGQIHYMKTNLEVPVHA